MRLGVCGGICPSDLHEVTPAFCQTVTAMGYSGVFTRFRDNDPLTVRRSDCETVRAIFADNGSDPVTRPRRATAQ